MKPKATRATRAPDDSPDDRVPTGVEGLDEIVGGGLPSKCFYLIQGDPGSGKTTLALQFLFKGLENGEPAFYVTLSETKRELTKVAVSHGWSLDGIALLDLSAIEPRLQAEAQNTVFRPSEVELDEVTSLILQQLEGVRPSRVVFDSLSEFRLIADTPLRYRRQLLTLKQEFARHGCTVLLLDDKMESNRIGTDPHVLSLTHGVIDMEQLSPEYGSSRRRLRIMKLRGVKFREGYHDYGIVTGGVRVFPRPLADDHKYEYVPEPVSSGVPALDHMLGGGIDRGTTTLLMGPAGTGKSTLALHYIVQRALAGEKSMVFIFDETRSLLLSRSKALGMDLQSHVAAGTILLQQVDPAELSPGEFAVRVRRGVEAGCRNVVIDSLNGYLNAMPGDSYLINQLHELCSFLNQQRVMTILVLAQQGMGATLDAPINISYLADSVINLRYFESAGEVKQAISVVKKRSGAHEKSIREFALEPGRGIRVGKPLREFNAIFTGTPAFTGLASDILTPGDAAEKP